MLKKVFILLSLVLMIMALSSNIINAANENVTINKTVTSFVDGVDGVDSGGEIILEISNLNLDEEATYKFKLEYNNMSTKLYDISTKDIENNKMTIKLDRSKSDIASILKITNEALLTIEETIGDETSNILDKHTVDIELPLSKAFWVGHYTSGYHGIDCVYDVDEIYYKYVLVEDADILEKYLNYLKTYDDNSEQYWGYYVDNLIDDLDMDKNYPTSGWQKLTGTQTTTQPTKEGLYFIWMKAPKSDNNKEITGCVFSKRFSDISVLEEQLDNVNNKQKEKVDDVNQQDQEQSKVDDEQTKKDNTIATKKLPNTGMNIAVICAIIVIVIVSILTYKIIRYYKYIK